MTLKDILVHIDDTQACAHRLDLALELTRSHDAHLAGLYVIPANQMSVVSEVPIPQEVFEEQEKLAQASAQNAEQAFGRKTEKLGISAEWRCERGDVVSSLNVHARYADLVVIGQDDPDASAFDSWISRAVLECGRPVLIDPHKGADKPPGKHILAAWNASRESTRALNDALPLMRTADQVTVLCVDSGSSETGADVGSHLARHGINAEVMNITAKSSEVGETLLSRAAGEGADLIVMGAYGHSRFRELILGGVTRHVLKHMTAPVLMSH